MQNALPVKFPTFTREPTNYNAPIVYQDSFCFKGNVLPTALQELSLLKVITHVPVSKIFLLVSDHESYSISYSGCSSSCSTCVGSPDFCLTCPSGQVLSAGRCISACPSATFSSSGSCIKCHPDCSTCSGTSFNQCSSCPPSRPVLTNGRCLSTCSKSQFLDTETCRSCDPSCSSCSGPGSSNCLGCSSSSQVLRGGSCVSANCQDSSSVIPRLGVCLSELVEVPSPSPPQSASEPPSSLSILPSLGSPSPLPTVTGLTDPIKATTNPHVKLTWWQILLMTLGGAFIFLIVIWCWRWRARKHRQKRTKNFAREKNLDGVHGWLVRLGQRLFPSRRNARDSLHSPKIRPIEDDAIFGQVAPPKSVAKELSTRKRFSMNDFISSYEHSPTSPVPSLDRRRKNENPKSRMERNSHSLFGQQRLTPNHREFSHRDPAHSRRSPSNSEGVCIDNRFNPTDQAYMTAIRPLIVGDMGVASQSHQGTLSRFPNYINSRPIEPRSTAVPQHMGGNRMPVTSTLNNQGPYTLPPVQQFQVPQRPLMVSQPMGASYANVSPHNPFRNRGS